MFTAYADERDFCFVSYYKCDFIRQAVGALFVSLYPLSQMQNRQLLLDKSKYATMWLCFVFSSVLF